MFLLQWPFRPRSVLHRNTTYRGAIASAGVLEINGQVEGRIDHDGLLIIGPQGCCSDYIQARSLRVAGKACGQIHVAGRLEILPGGCIEGAVTCASLRIHQGGVLLGSNQMEGGRPAPALDPQAAAAPVPPVSSSASAAPQPRTELPQHAAAVAEVAATVLPGPLHAEPVQTAAQTGHIGAGDTATSVAQPDGALVFRGARRAPPATLSEPAAAEELAGVTVPSLTH